MSGSNGDAAISELARRILRSSGVKIIHDGELMEEIESLAAELSILPVTPFPLRRNP